MFNKTDDWNACCKAAKRITQHPRDYFQGLPDTPLILPKNLLLFTRQKAFSQGQGSAHHRFLLILCLQGDGSVIVDDHVARLTPGSALLVTPLQFHHYARFTGGPLLWLFLSFELDEVEALSALRGRVLELTPLQVTCLKQLAGTYTDLGEKRMANPEITLLAALILGEFHGTSAPGSPAKPAPSKNTRGLIQEVARQVHLHVGEAIQIADVARAVGLSESHLRARFQAAAGLGLGAYIRRLRLHRARTMMLATELRLKEIAERCGYDSIYTFSRAFHREMGMSPSRYRKPDAIPLASLT
ncbi:MAG: AraC family transcriptional regulator [bacterium]